MNHLLSDPQFVLLAGMGMLALYWGVQAPFGRDLEDAAKRNAVQMMQRFVGVGVAGTLATILLVLYVPAVRESLVVDEAPSISQEETPSSLDEEPPQLARMMLEDDAEITVELANSPQKRSRGLSNREPIGFDAGMLFLMPSKDIHQFWMKDMRFALDFIWLEGTTIVDIDQNIAPLPGGLPFVTPEEPADRVLEVQAGFVERHQLQVGDHIYLYL